MPVTGDARIAIHCTRARRSWHDMTASAGPTYWHPRPTGPALSRGPAEMAFGGAPAPSPSGGRGWGYAGASSGIVPPMKNVAATGRAALLAMLTFPAVSHRMLVTAADPELPALVPSARPPAEAGVP